MLIERENIVWKKDITEIFKFSLFLFFQQWKFNSHIFNCKKRIKEILGYLKSLPYLS